MSFFASGIECVMESVVCLTGMASRPWFQRIFATPEMRTSVRGSIVHNAT